MKNAKKLKEIIYYQFQKIVEQRISTAQQAIKLAGESRDTETKSTAGDKHETGRAMMQLEQEQNNAQLQKAMELQNEFSKINCSKLFSKVELGSLVITNQENYFISVGLGKIEIENKFYYALSLASPVGLLLKDKRVGDKVIFLEREITILEIL